MWLLKEPLWVEADAGLSALSADAASQLNIFGHDGDPLGVDGAQVSVLKQTDQISLAGLLQGHDSGALEAQVRLKVLSDFSHQPLEGQFADQQLSGLLIAADLPQSHGPGPVAMRLLDAAGGRSALTGGFSSELLPRGFTTGGFTSGLLGSCHCCSISLCPACAGNAALCYTPAFKALNHHELMVSQGYRPCDWLIRDVCA
ncbi:hypothetical protein PO909_021210 [Leuciscus waleckii]